MTGTMSEQIPPTRRWSMLLLVSIAEMLAISVWLVSTAISQQLEEVWQLAPWQSAALTTSVQIGFVVGTLLAALLNLADLFPNRLYFSVCAIMTALCNLALLVCDGFWAAMLARLLVGFFLAGVYPPAMKMIATWFERSRGLAIGTVVGALTLGKSLPFLLKAMHWDQWQDVILFSSVMASMSAFLIYFLYSDGPYSFSRRPFNIALIREVFGNKKIRLAIGGYLGHMWELYAMWTWISCFMLAAADRSGIESSYVVDLVTFLIIGAGSVGCVLGGQIADRIGRERFVNIAMVASGICCVAIGFCYGVGFVACAIVAIIWGFFVVADSAQFSTIVTEVSPKHAVGTALTLQTSVGFLLTTITIQMIPLLQKQVGWEWAFAVLVIGPLFGIAAIRQLSIVRKSANSK